MSELEYEAGSFVAYRATTVINVGSINTSTSGYNVAKDEVFQYDGDTIILKDGREFPGITQLRGAIKAGWFVRAEDQEAIYRPKSADIQVRDPKQQGYDQAPRRRVVTHQSEEATVGSVASRTADREAKHLAVSKGLPLSPAQVRSAQDRPSQVGSAVEVSEISDFEFYCDDEEMNEVAAHITAQVQAWWKSKYEVEAEPEELEDVRLRIETDMLSMFSMLEDMDEPVSSQNPRPHQIVKPKAKAAVAIAVAPPPREAAPVKKAERPLRMPVTDGDADIENHGQVVGSVRFKTTVEEERSVDLNLPSSKPRTTSPAPERRFGGTGAIVVADETDLGLVALSGSSRAPIQLEESAQIVQTSTDSVRMGVSAEVGPGGRRRATVLSDNEGVPVGRIKSPTHRSFVASDANTNSVAVDKVAEGKPFQVERIARATGDVQEARTGESLEDLLPDAAQPPVPPKKYLPEDQDPAYQAIKALIPDFVWDRNRRWQDRVEDSMKYVKNPQYMKGILAVETETVREEIKKRLAEVLQAE